MSLHSGSSRLALGLKELRARWEEVKGKWKDPVQRAFEEDQMEPLEEQVMATLRGIERLGQALDQARHECE